MQKTLRRDSDIYLTVTADTLAGLLNCGKATAAKIGKDAGARIQIGRRVLYRVPLVERYLDSLATDE